MMRQKLVHVNNIREGPSMVCLMKTPLLLSLLLLPALFVVAQEQKWIVAGTSARVNWSRQLTDEEAKKITRKNVFGDWEIKSLGQQVTR